MLGLLPWPGLCLVMHHAAGGKSRGLHPCVCSAVPFLLLLLWYFQLSIIQAPEGNRTGLCQKAWKNYNNCYLQYLELFLINFLFCPFVFEPSWHLFLSRTSEIGQILPCLLFVYPNHDEGFCKTICIWSWCIIHSFPKAEFPWQLMNKD